MGAAARLQMMSRVMNAVVGSLILLAMLTRVQAQSQTVSSAITPLSVENYESVLSQKPITLVLFHDPANTTTANEEIIREFEFAAILLQQMITAASVDFQSHTDVAALFNVSSGPAIRLIWSGGPVKVYEGDASAKSLVNVALAESVLFQKWKTEERAKIPAIKRVDAALELAQVMGSGRPALVGYFENPDSASEYQVYKNVAELYREHKIDIFMGEVVHPDLLAKLKISKFPSLSLYNPEVGVEWYPTEANFTVEEIVAWSESGRQQMFTQLTKSNVGAINKQNCAIIFLNLTDDQSSAFVLGLRSTAVEMASNLQFFFADTFQMRDLAHRMGVTVTNKPRMVLWNPSQGHHFNFLPGKPLTPKSISKFCTDFLENKLAPSFKSAPRPEGNDGVVIQLVTDTFQEIVGQPSSDVVVCIYSGASAQSQLLLRIFKQAAQSLTHVDGLVFAQMDEDDNDLLPGVPQQVPGIFMFPAGAKRKVASYGGVATLNGLLHFVDEHSTIALNANEEIGVEDGRKELQQWQM